ncbi:MAG: sugar ABC transporter ATP-binding protein [Armatimonadetes bacterium]|nr:sugar ABC transporter ATP-binding protein [Armatimonadota bacterium]
MTEQTNLILDMKSISKTFPGVRALSNVDFCVKPGEVHSVMGENGAGKSTLLKILTGVYSLETGKIVLDGKPFKPTSPVDAQAKGISAIHQEVSLLPYQSVAENIMIGRQPKNFFGAIRWGELNRLANIAMQRLGLNIDVTRSISDYPVAIRQMVSIARAVDMKCKILVMDEPTSSLDEGEVKELFAVVRNLRDEGVGIVFVTHFLDQVYQITDRITVLRNGELVGMFEAAQLPKLGLVGHMLGKNPDEVQALFVQKAESAHVEGSKPFVEARGLGRVGAVKPFDLEIRSGEVLGLAGLLGSGRTEAARLFFGADKPTSGTIAVDGKNLGRLSPKVAIDNGIGFSPEDRRTEGIIPDLSVRENICLAIHKKISPGGFISLKKQVEIAEKYVKALNISTPSIEQPVKNLSGGNQQKVILARWLASQPKLLILDEPTRGIDVGAKSEVETAMKDLSKDGMAILFISSELEEVVRSSHRVAVMKDRAKIAELSGDQIDEQVIMSVIAGGGQHAQTN